MHAELQATSRAKFPSPIFPQRTAVERVVRLVSEHCEVPATLILSTARGRLGIARSRQLAMYLAHVMLGESLSAVGAAFGRDRTTVSYACGLIEDMRDDPVFDAEVSVLEQQVQGEAD